MVNICEAVAQHEKSSVYSNSPVTSCPQAGNNAHTATFSKDYVVNASPHYRKSNMSPVDDAVKPIPPTLQIFSPSSTPGPAVASKHIANGPDADSDGKNKSDGDCQLLEKAVNHIINIKTLTRLCNLGSVDAVRIRDTLIKNYTDTCQRQAYRVTFREVLHDNLLAAL